MRRNVFVLHLNFIVRLPQVLHKEILILFTALDYLFPVGEGTAKLRYS